MRNVSLVAALLIASTTHLANAQNIPATVQQAEAEGANFGHEASQVVGQSYFTESPFGGTADRRCVAGAAQNLDGSLRSGDFIVRGRVDGTFRVGKERKVLWIPLHVSASRKPPLVVRAARVGNPADSVRLRIDGLAHGGGSVHGLYGYQSLVSFPSAGQWVVIATAGNDWGCFVLDVDQQAGSN